MKEDYIFVKEETFLTRFCEDLLVPQRSLYVSPVNLTEVETAKPGEYAEPIVQCYCQTAYYLL